MIITFVSIGPGAIQLNLIPYLPHSAASDLQNILDLNFTILFIATFVVYCYSIPFFAVEIHDLVQNDQFSFLWHLVTHSKKNPLTYPVSV